MSADAAVTGWYGKLPSLGDFATRRLAPGFVEAWDDWLAAGLAAWREQAPDDWLDAYLASPSWRFVLMPGVMPGAVPGVMPSANQAVKPAVKLGGVAGNGPERHAAGSGRVGTDSAAWAGVLMPSVDRVGRYFPLTLVRALPALPADAAQADELLRWLHRLDDLAIDALQDDWSVDQLETELTRLGAWEPPSSAAFGPAWPEAGAAMVELDAAVGVSTLLAATASQGLLQALQGKALWLCDDGAGQPALRITAGLPAAEDFCALLSRSAAPTLSTPT